MNTATTITTTVMSAARVVLSMRAPTQPSSAGSSVSDASTISSTPTAEAMATPVTNVEAHQRQPEQGDDDRRPGEDDGPPAGVERFGDRVVDGEPAVQRLPVSGDDEQRVVDADAETDHRDHRRCEVRHRQRVAEQRDDGAGDAEAEQRDADREAHREHRAERDDEDDDRGEHAVGLAGRQARTR